MKVYLVEDCGNNPGRVYAVFADELDAEAFATALDDKDIVVSILARTVFYGQPPYQGFNP